MLDVSWEPRITKQWDIPYYNDPWDRHRQESRNCNPKDKVPYQKFSYSKMYKILDLDGNVLTTLRSQLSVAAYIGVHRSTIAYNIKNPKQMILKKYRVVHA
jgi:hypothetical protein